MPSPMQWCRRSLQRWRNGATMPAVTRVVITAAGDRAFSAGGDIRALYELGKAGRYDEALRFWWDEYRLNTVIKRYPKALYRLGRRDRHGWRLRSRNARFAPRRL